MCVRVACMCGRKREYEVWSKQLFLYLVLSCGTLEDDAAAATLAVVFDVSPFVPNWSNSIDDGPDHDAMEDDVANVRCDRISCIELSSASNSSSTWLKLLSALDTLCGLETTTSDHSAGIFKGNCGCCIWLRLSSCWSCSRCSNASAAVAGWCASGRWSIKAPLKMSWISSKDRP